MKKQLLTLQQLIGVMDPELYRHLGLLPSYPVYRPSLNSHVSEKTEALNLFFCFRCVSLFVLTAEFMPDTGFQLGAHCV
jgi:hypothetical protein